MFNAQPTDVEGKYDGEVRKRRYEWWLVIAFLERDGGRWDESGRVTGRRWCTCLFVCV